MFVFPVLMAVALGIAFPSRTVDTVIVGVAEVQTPLDHQGIDCGAWRRGQASEPGRGSLALRRATCSSSSRPGSTPAYRFDPARPESRLARRVVDDALQRAAGRSDPFVPRDEQRRRPARATWTGWCQDCSASPS